MVETIASWTRQTAETLTIEMMAAMSHRLIKSISGYEGADDGMCLLTENGVCHNPQPAGETEYQLPTESTTRAPQSSPGQVTSL
jgi:hypothetical protein